MEMRVNPWFRFYHAVLDDPKVQRLPDRLFKAWVNLLCLASRHGGRLPPIGDVAFALRVAEGEAAEIVTALAGAALIDREGETFRIHNWDGRQFQSDGGGAERSRRFRARRRDVSRNGAVTSPESEPESESEQSTIENPDADASGAQRNPQGVQHGAGPNGATLFADLAAWEPGDTDRRYAEACGLDAARVLADLRAWAANAARARRIKRDPSAFWQSWCRRDADRAAERNRGGSGQSGPRGSRNPGLLAAAAEVIAFDALRGDPSRE
jgi:hypothetical protein